MIQRFLYRLEERACICLGQAPNPPWSQTHPLNPNSSNWKVGDQCAGRMSSFFLGAVESLSDLDGNNSPSLPDISPLRVSMHLIPFVPS